MDVIAPGLEDVLIIFAASAAVVIAFHYFKQPSLAGFLLCGVLIGPNALGWIQSSEASNQLAELGIVLLLFSLGVEFSFKRARRMMRAFLGLGALQCLITSFIVTSAGIAIGFDWRTAFVWGSIVSLSSTAVVIKMLHQRRETVTPQGQASIAVLLFQDLWIIPVLVTLPLISPQHAAMELGVSDIFQILAKGVSFVAIVYVSAKFIVPYLLKIVARTQIRELFLIVVALLSVGSAVLTAKMGLSVALGAFIAGMIISESEYGHQAVADILPFREIFMALFFVAAGMLLDYQFFLEHFAVILLLAGSVLTLKFLVTATLASLLGYSSQLAALIALSLAQIGEFSFVLANEASKYALLSPEHNQMLLSVTLLLMALTPLLITIAPRLAPSLARFDLVGSRVVRKINSKPSGNIDELKEHVVIIGYGHNGQTLAEVLRNTNIAYTVIESNHRLFEKGLKAKHNILFGDATQKEVIESANVGHAKIIVIAINDKNSTRRIVLSLKQHNPNAHVIVRCHYIEDTENLKTLGVHETVVGEQEMSTELLARVLQNFGHSLSYIQTEIDRLPQSDYQSIRKIVNH